MVALSIAFVVPGAGGRTDGALARNMNRGSVWSGPELLVLCAVFFLYVGAENSINGWVAAYGKEANAASQLPLVTSSFFYFALVVGRFAAPFMLRRMSEILLARMGLAITVAGIAALLLSHTLSQITLSALITGLGLSSVFPIAIAMLSQRFGADSPRAGSVAFNMANLGGATLPFLVGYCSSRFTSLTIGLAVPLAAATIMLAIFSVPVTSEILFTPRALWPD